VSSWLVFSRFFAEKLGADPREDELWQNVGKINISAVVAADWD